MTKKNPQTEVSSRRIYLGLVDCTSITLDREAAVALLDEAEKKRLDGFRGASRKAEFLGGRLLAKSMASRLLGIRAESVSIELEPSGKPRFTGALSLGIAHSAGAALCAIADFPIGLDLEARSTKRDLASIATVAFSVPERAAMNEAQSEGEAAERFFAVWTLKEAHLKLSGLGIGALSEAPSFALDLALGGSVALGGGAEGLDYLCLSLGGRFMAALAFPRGSAGTELIFDSRFAPPAELSPRVLCSTCQACLVSP